MDYQSDIRSMSSPSLSDDLFSTGSPYMGSIAMSQQYSSSSHESYHQGSGQRHHPNSWPPTSYFLPDLSPYSPSYPQYPQSYTSAGYRPAEHLENGTISPSIYQRHRNSDATTSLYSPLNIELSYSPVDSFSFGEGNTTYRPHISHYDDANAHTFVDSSYRHATAGNSYHFSGKPSRSSVSKSSSPPVMITSAPDDESPNGDKLKYWCNHPDCLDDSGKPTKGYSRNADVHRHHRSRHDIRMIDCSYSRCQRKGDSGFARRDHLIEHLRQYHDEKIPKRGGGIEKNRTRRGSRKRHEKIEDDC